MTHPTKKRAKVKARRMWATYYGKSDPVLHQSKPVAMRGKNPYATCEVVGPIPVFVIDGDDIDGLVEQVGSMLWETTVIPHQFQCYNYARAVLKSLGIARHKGKGEAS